MCQIPNSLFVVHIVWFYPPSLHHILILLSTNCNNMKDLFQNSTNAELLLSYILCGMFTLQGISMMLFQDGTDVSDVKYHYWEIPVYKYLFTCTMANINWFLICAKYPIHYLLCILYDFIPLLCIILILLSGNRSSDCFSIATIPG